MRVNIGDLANTDDISPTRDQLVEHGVCVWWRRKVTTIACANVGVRPISDERSRNDSTYVVLIDELSRNIAKVIQAL